MMFRSRPVTDQPTFIFNLSPEEVTAQETAELRDWHDTPAYHALRKVLRGRATGHIEDMLTLEEPERGKKIERIHEDRDLLSLLDSFRPKEPPHVPRY